MHTSFLDQAVNEIYKPCKYNREPTRFCNLWPKTTLTQLQQFEIPAAQIGGTLEISWAGPYFRDFSYMSASYLWNYMPQPRRSRMGQMGIDVDDNSVMILP
jgi:hypothetical protein